MFSALKACFFLDVAEQTFHHHYVEVRLQQAEATTVAAELPMVIFENDHCRGQITHTVKRFRGKHILQAWLSHLLLACDANEKRQGKNTYMLSSESIICLKPIDRVDALRCLTQICTQYALAQQAALPLFIDSGYEAWRAFDKTRKSSRARKFRPPRCCRKYAADG